MDANTLCDTLSGLLDTTTCQAALNTLGEYKTPIMFFTGAVGTVGLLYTAYQNRDTSSLSAKELMTQNPLYQQTPAGTAQGNFSSPRAELSVQEKRALLEEQEKKAKKEAERVDKLRKKQDELALKPEQSFNQNLAASQAIAFLEETKEAESPRSRHRSNSR
jgi:hypothetical protein